MGLRSQHGHAAQGVAQGAHASVTQALGERIRGQLSNCARGFPTRHAASPAEQLAYGCFAVDSDAQRGLLPALDCRRECWKSEPSEHARAAAMRMTALRAIALPRDCRSSGSSGFVRETGPACCRNTAGASRQDRPNLNTAVLPAVGRLRRTRRCRSSRRSRPARRGSAPPEALAASADSAPWFAVAGRPSTAPRYPAVPCASSAASRASSTTQLRMSAPGIGFLFVPAGVGGFVSHCSDVRMCGKQS